MINQELTVIGRAEKAIFPQLGNTSVPVKIDTGADASSIWAHIAERTAEGIKVVFFGPDSLLYTGDEYLFKKDDFEVTRVASSFGHKEIRYKIKLKIKIKGRVVNGTFTLSDRSRKLYPVLIGRSLLVKKFVVDVSQGSPLKKEERRRRDSMKEELLDLNEVEL